MVIWICNFLFYNVCLAVKYFFLIFKALSVHHNVIPVVCVPGKKMSSPSHIWNKRRVLVCQYWLISLLKHALFIRRHKTNHRGKTLAQFETTRHKPCSICVCVCTAYHITPFISFGKILRELWTKMLHTYLGTMLSRRPVDLLQRINQKILSHLDKIDIT